jgi:hypothetical protein
MFLLWFRSLSVIECSLGYGVRLLNLGQFLLAVTEFTCVEMYLITFYLLVDLLLDFDNPFEYWWYFI